MSKTAVRIDERAGIREEVEFFGPAAERLYGCRHAPLGRPLAGVVICCSIHAELQERYRSEVLLARALAGRGLAVQRFHYRGFGHSDGAPEAVTFERMREDALHAVERLRTTAGVTTCALLGARMGGLVAASAAGALGRAPLVLVEPVRDPVAYLREAIRARRIHQLHTGASAPLGRDARDELRETGVLDVLGYPIHRAFYESVVERTLDVELGTNARPLLLAQLSRGRELRPDAARLVRRLRAAGFPVEAVVVDDQPAWWFARGSERGVGVLGTTVARWLEARLR